MTMPKGFEFSGNVSSNLNGLGIVYDEDMVIVLTRQKVPVCLKVVAALGKKFCYSRGRAEVPFYDFLVCMEKIKDGCTSYQEYVAAKRNSDEIRRYLESSDVDFTSNRTRSQSYIDQLRDRALDFLSKNKSIVVLPADKGGKAVIMDWSQYVDRMESHIRDNVDAGSIPARIVLKPYIVPLMYGCPKVHKDGQPIRPIISSYDMIGFLSKWLLEKLQIIAEHLDRYNVKNSEALVFQLRDFHLEPDHELVLFDYVSMFTNIDVCVALDIVSSFYYLVQRTTTVPVEVFMEALALYTTHTAYFVFGGSIYLQSKGLAMGNRLAQVLAEIRTNHALMCAVGLFDATIISFIFKYVDDIFAAVHPEFIERLHSKIQEWNSLSRVRIIDGKFLTSIVSLDDQKMVFR